MTRKLWAIAALMMAAYTGHAQATLSPEERRILIEEIKREILDSMRVEKANDAIQDSVKKDLLNDWKGKVTFSGYAEVYYGFDFGMPQDNNRPGFVYMHNRHNEVNINLAYLKANYTADRVRANVGIMVGNYGNTVLSAEPGVLKNLMEANVGIKISKKKDVWIDAGVFPAHIGWESYVGKDCKTLTRSIAAENSPYFETGVKLTYTSDNGKLTTSALVLNGWQRIQRVSGSSLPSFGWQVTYKPSDKFTINSSSFIGTDKPDSTRQMRYFHDLYAVFQPIDVFGAIIGFDIGAEQTAKKSKTYNVWYTPVAILYFNPIKQLSLGLRYEYYSDTKGVLIYTGTANGFKTHGASLNLDVNIRDNVMWRVEGKGYFSQDEIFTLRNKPSQQNYSVCTALAVSF